MENLSLFCMTKKGYHVLKVVSKKYPGLISIVVGARDDDIEKDYYDEIKNYCKKNKIIFYDKSDLFKISSSYMLAISWKWMIKSTNTPLIVMHDSLLPKYRGFSPLVTALINGDSKVGVTALFGSEKFDCGDIISQSESVINYPIKIKDAINVIIKNYEELALYIAKKIYKQENINSNTQDDSKASYSLWRDEEDYHIDWNLDSHTIKRFIDAVGYPYNGASTKINDKKVRVLDAIITDDLDIANRQPGKVIYFEKEFPVVVCGKGLIMLTRVVDDTTKTSIFPLKKLRLRLE